VSKQELWGNRKVRWVGDDSHVAFGPKFPGEKGSVNRTVSVFEETVRKKKHCMWMTCLVSSVVFSAVCLIQLNRFTHTFLFAIT
jgi:hypothetical protein